MTANLLHLDSSARSRSFSRRLSRAFADGWRAQHPRARYHYRDLAADQVPPIGEAWTEICDNVLRDQITEPSNYAQAVRTDAQRAAWQVVEPLSAELLAADVVVIGTPMYNFSVPSALKAWIDQVTFPRMSLKGRTFVISGARGGSYQPPAPRAPYDHHERYLRDFIEGHFAVTDVVFIHAELTNALVDSTLGHLRPEHDVSARNASDRVLTSVAEISKRREQI